MKKTLCTLMTVLLVIALLPSAFAEDKTITVWMGSWWADDVARVEEAFAADPANEGYDLVIETFPNNSYVEKIIAAVLGGTAPDVAAIDVTFLGALMRRDLLIEFTEEDLAEMDVEDFKPGIWNSCLYDGKAYAIPYRGGIGEAFVLNKALFEQAGVPLPEEDWTLEDFLEICEALKAGANGEFYPYAVAGSTVDPANFESSFTWLLYANGGSWVNEEQTEVTMDSEGSVAAIQMWMDLFENGYVPEGCINYTISNDVLPMFTEGKIAMMNYSDAYVDAIKESDIDYVVYKTPSGFGRTGGWLFTIPISTENEAGAKQFVKWFTESDNLGELMIRMPSRISSTENYAPWNSEDYAVLNEAAALAKAPPTLPEFTELRLIIITEMQKAVMGEQTAEEAAANIVEQGNALIAEGMI